MTKDIKKYDFIDALRGYAILVVILHHCRNVITPINTPLKVIMSNGVRGFQLFFIASASTFFMS